MRSYNFTQYSCRIVIWPTIFKFGVFVNKCTFFFSNVPLHNNCLYHYDTEITTRTGTSFLELQRTKKNKHSR